MRIKKADKLIDNRVSLTISDRSCDYIPKVKNAGKIIDNYQIMHNGLKVIKRSCDTDWMKKIIKELKGHHEPQEEKVFYEILKDIKEGSTMLELGSSWSYYSMWFAKEIKNSKNIMIEPNQEKLERGIDNFRINKLTSSIFIKGQIGNKFKNKSNFFGKEIHQFSIDYILDKYQIKNLSILHSDIQGSEFNMLRGASNALDKKSIDYFFISTHHDAIHTLCIQLLKGKGYNIICQHTIAESSSADGLIVASSKKRDKIEIFKVKTKKNSIVKKSKNLLRYLQYKFQK